MESERNILIEAWKICSQQTTKDLNQYKKAYEYIETFKKTSNFILDIGFEMANSTVSYELAHFGLHLISDVIKFKWNTLDSHIKLVIKNKLVELISNLDSKQQNDIKKSPIYFKNTLCLTFLELVKREWPQNWPSLLTELIDISRKTVEQQNLVLIIFKYIAEEFIINENPNIPVSRRKDIIQYLNANMEFLYAFFLDCLEKSFSLFKINNEDRNQVLLVNSSISCLINYVDWINFNLIFSKEFTLINIILSSLHFKDLCIESSRCLLSILNRKGSLTERKPIIQILNDHLLNKIYECVQLSITNYDFKDLLKYLVQILTAVGTQLNGLWVESDFVPPFDLSCYFNSMFQLIVNENRIYSSDAIQLWISLMSNQFLQANPLILQATQSLSKLMINSKLLFKINTDNLIDEFNSEEDFKKFAQKYRTDVAKLIKLGSNLQLMDFLSSSFDWASTILYETSKLSADDQTGYDTNSLLFICWDALIFLWTTIMQVLNKKIKEKTYTDENEVMVIKEKLLTLISSCIKFSSFNANYCSYNLSLLSSVLISCEFEYETDKSQMILKTIIEKLFNEFIIFQNKYNELEASGNKNVLKCIQNLKRQIVSNILNICRKYASSLKAINEEIYYKSMCIISNEHSTQIERVIFIQSLIYCSNESNTYDAQAAFIDQFISPISKFFSSDDFQNALHNIQLFIKYFGFDEGINTEMNLTNASLQKRRQMFYFVNVLYSILKSVRNTEESTMENIEIQNLSNSGFLDSKTNRLRNPAFASYIQVLEVILQFLKSMNIMHSKELRNCMKAEYLEMTESAKSVALGTNQQISSSAVSTSLHCETNIMSSESEKVSDKVLMFYYNVYEMLNQLVPLYFLKFKNELLLNEATEINLQFINKIGDALFSNFNELPDFRIRFICKYTLKAALTFHFKPEYIEKDYVIVRINEILLQFFLPSILTRINTKIKYFQVLKEESKSKPESDVDTESPSIQNQIIEENQFILMCRDLVELLRLFLNFSSGAINKPLAQEFDEFNNEKNDMNQNELEIDSSPKALENLNPNKIHISELAVHLLKNNKIIFQSTILLLFEGLNWSDSHCCLRLARLAMSLFEKVSVNNTVEPQKIVFYLNDNVGEQLFKSCITSLQLHGEHHETASLLTNLGFLIYEKFPYSAKGLFNDLLSKIPNINTKMYEEFVKLNNPNNQPKDLLKHEKIKKDYFKKIIQPIIGKNVSQLYKNEIEIKQLQPMNLKTRKTNENTEIFDHSLFD